jgi:hypothetical protein
MDVCLKNLMATPASSRKIPFSNVADRTTLELLGRNLKAVGAMNTDVAEAEAAEHVVARFL